MFCRGTRFCCAFGSGFSGFLFGHGLLGCGFRGAAFCVGRLPSTERLGRSLSCLGFPGGYRCRLIGPCSMSGVGCSFGLPVRLGLRGQITLDLQGCLLDHCAPGSLVVSRCCRCRGGRCCCGDGCRWGSSCCCGDGGRWGCSSCCGFGGRCECGRRGFGWGHASRGRSPGPWDYCRFGNGCSGGCGGRRSCGCLLCCLVGLHDQGLLHQRGCTVGHGLPGFGQRLLLGLGTLCCSGKLRRGFGGFLILILAAEKTKHVVGSGKASVPRF